MRSRLVVEGEAMRELASNMIGPVLAGANCSEGLPVWNERTRSVQEEDACWVGVEGTVGGRSGCLFGYEDVPDYSKANVEVSVLWSFQVIPSRAPDELHPTLELMPTATLCFQMSGETVADRQRGRWFERTSEAARHCLAKFNVRCQIP